MTRALDRMTENMRKMISQVGKEATAVSDASYDLMGRLPL